QAQIEVITSPHTNMADARAELRELRRTLAAVAGEDGLAVLSAGTHPAAGWGTAAQRQKEGCRALGDGLHEICQGDLSGGLHVHVEMPDSDTRIDVMGRMLPYLPLLLALSTSSPFWQSRITGLKGYRLAAYDELPRTGLPPLFRSRAEFDAYIEALVRAGVMQDSSFVRWAIRPSLNNPTLELRAPDCCTLVEDSIAIAALYRTLARHLCLNPSRNSDIDVVGRAIAVENKWRAQRYGVSGTFVTPDGAVAVADLLDRTIEETAADAEALGCADEIRRCRAIAGAGTSADAQLAVFEANNTESPEVALRAVTEWIATATLQ